MIPLTDKQIRDLLLKIDESDEITVTTLEAEFLEEILLEEILFKRGGEWNVEQRARAAQIVEKYRHQL